MDDKEEPRSPWESREWVELEPQDLPPPPPDPRPPTLIGWIGAVWLIAGGVWPWFGGGQIGIVNMALSAFMVTAGVALAFVLIRRLFVPPEKDGRS